MEAINRDNLASGFEGTIGEYFRVMNLKSGGLIEQFHVNPFTKKRHNFANHVELDEYVREFLQEFAAAKKLSTKNLVEIADICSKDDEYKFHFALLKAFDRGYWLRLAKFNKMVQTWTRDISMCKSEAEKKKKQNWKNIYEAKMVTVRCLCDEKDCKFFFFVKFFLPNLCLTHTVSHFLTTTQ